MALVFIPSLLRNTTGGLDRVEVEGSTLRQVVENLDAAYPGIKDALLQDNRIRPGLALAVNGLPSVRGLMETVPEGAEVQIMPAIAGGASR